MDVEGAEWGGIPVGAGQRARTDRSIAVEFHGTAEDRYPSRVRRLRRFFHVAHLHFNFACWPALEPFPAWAYEVLFVSKRVGIVDLSRPPDRPHRLDAPNNLRAADCQAASPSRR